MIFKVEGDIFFTKASTIVQGVGINDPMDKELALALSNQFPEMCTDFNRWCHQHNKMPGEVWLWKGANTIRIVNLITHRMLLIVMIIVLAKPRSIILGILCMP